jgi:hypothetical protein
MAAKIKKKYSFRHVSCAYSLVNEEVLMGGFEI